VTVNDLAQAWESFYVIVGSSAGALTGLQFVVLTLIIESGGLRGRTATVSAFGSPNVVHFCAALLVSAIFSAPWHGLRPPGVAVALCGAAGFIYSVMVLRRTLRQEEYKPVLEDWIWHAVLPMLAYLAMVHAGIMLARNAADTLYIVGAATLLLVFIGIHNAWDTVMYLAVYGVSGQERAESAAPSTAPRSVAPGAPALGAAAPAAPQSGEGQSKS
jgi:hypothetical protein